MSSLENLMDNVLQNTQQLWKHNFAKTNQDVTNHLSHLPTSTVLQRQARQKETRLFTISSDEAQVAFLADLVKEMKDIRSGSSKKDAIQLLTLANTLNKICTSTSVQKRIIEMEQRYENYQATLATCYDSNGYEMAMHEKDTSTQERQQGDNPLLTEKKQQIIQGESKVTATANLMKEWRQKAEHVKLLAKEKRQLLKQMDRKQQVNLQSRTTMGNTNDKLSESDAQRTKDAHAQLKKITQLKNTIHLEKVNLKSTSSSSSIIHPSQTSSVQSSSISTPALSSYLNTIPDLAPVVNDQCLRLLESSKIHATKTLGYQQKETSSDVIISIMTLCIQAMQNNMVCYDASQSLEDEMNHLTLVRQQVATKTDQEIQDVIKKIKDGDQDAGHEILMAMALNILHQHNGKIHFEDLKNKITDYATQFGLGSSSLGSSIIYSWIGTDVFSIDRSQTDSIVQSNWK